MNESGEIIHGTNKMRFESERDLSTHQWKEVNAKMKHCLRLAAQDDRFGKLAEGERLGKSPALMEDESK